MARRSSKSVRYDDDLVELPIDGLPARVEPSYFDLRGRVVQARKDLTSYHALVRKPILAGRKEADHRVEVRRLVVLPRADKAGMPPGPADHASAAFSPVPLETDRDHRLPQVRVNEPDLTESWQTPATSTHNRGLT